MLSSIMNPEHQDKSKLLDSLSRTQIAFNLTTPTDSDSTSETAVICPTGASVTDRDARKQMTELIHLEPRTSCSSTTITGSNSFTQKLLRQHSLKQFRTISRRLAYQYKNVVPTPFESIKFVANPIRGKFSEIDLAKNVVHSFGFFIHIQDKWVGHSAEVLAASILNGLFTASVNFHAHSMDLTFSQVERLFEKVRSRVSALGAEVDVLLHHRRYLCPCGQRFDEAAAFWQHYRQKGRCIAGPAEGNGPNCVPVDRHICQCGLVFDQHSAWAAHVLPQDWPVCGMALLAHLFALESLHRAADERLAAATAASILLFNSNGTAGVCGDQPMGPVLIADEVVSGADEVNMPSDIGTDSGMVEFRCCACFYTAENYFLYLLHIVYCERFLDELEKNCPFCKFRYGATYYDPRAQHCATDHSTSVQIRSASSASISSRTGSFDRLGKTSSQQQAVSGDRMSINTCHSNNSYFSNRLSIPENWTLILCKICLLFGITIENVSCEG